MRSDSRSSLDAEAVELFLEILELREPSLSGAAAELRPGPTALLTAAGLLVPHGHEAVTASLADHNDVPVTLVWSEQERGLAYFDPSIGLTAVPRERLVRRRVDMAATLAAISSGLDLPQGRPSLAIAGELLWEIGEVRIGKRPARIPLWFARRLADMGVQHEVANAARARPHTRQRVILTSSRPERLRDLVIPGAIVVALRDVMAVSDRLAVDSDILDARLRGMVHQQRGGPLILSPDGTRLSINGGAPLQFKSDAMIAAIRKLVAAYKSGERVPIADLTELGSPKRLFGTKRWEQLSPYVKSVNGLWGFDL